MDKAVCHRHPYHSIIITIINTSFKNGPANCVLHKYIHSALYSTRKAVHLMHSQRRSHGPSTEHHCHILREVRWVEHLRWVINYPVVAMGQILKNSVKVRFLKERSLREKDSKLCLDCTKQTQDSLWFSFFVVHWSRVARGEMVSLWGWCWRWWRMLCRSTWSEAGVAGSNALWEGLGSTW